MYENQEKLELKKQVWVTILVYDILRKQKKKQKISLAKIVCNLILEKYGNETVSKMQKEEMDI